MTQLQKLETELNRLFDLFNQKYYSGSLCKPIIVVQSNGKDRRTMGWCTCEKVWKDHTKQAYYYEISICSEYLYRDVKEICSTLLHEMVHLYCQENDIKDTSRGNTYHNKRFKSVAESHGLVISYDKRIGWSITELSPSSIAFVEINADSSAFILTRKRHVIPHEAGNENIGKEEKSKQSFRKYVCPGCGCIIRATKEVNIICGDCNLAFVKKEF